jgi:NADH:ubiquinone oxidoreductase subunit 5 (subunit L)/multisubunit Na+/H+ antiporter MnhA subunit
MYILVVFLPLFGFLLVSLLGNYFGRKGSVFITTIFIFFSFLFSLVIFYEIVLSHCIILINFFTWMDVNGLLVSFCFLFDSLTSVMLVVVTSISLLVHFYSIDYMRYDPHISRFMGYLSLFTFFMLILVTSNNFVQMFMGWEGVGLASYLLINF